MWTTSSSRADGTGRTLLVCFALTFALACSTPLRQPALSRPAPDAPRPARPAVAPPDPAPDHRPPAPVELRSVTLRRVVEGDLLEMAGSEFMARAREPLALEVRTVQPLGNLARTASPVIELNEETFPDTWAIAPDRLIAFLPDRTRLRPTNFIVVYWLGDEARTRTRKPLVFREDVLIP